MTKKNEKQIGELDRELALLRGEKNKLILEAQKWADKRNRLHDQIRQSRIQATARREKRNDLNQMVQQLKNLREQTRSQYKITLAKILDLERKIEVLVEKEPSKDLKSVQREIENLEWKIQTTPLTVKEEMPIINQVRSLETQLLAHKKTKKMKEDHFDLRAELKSLEKEAETYHERLAELAQQSQETHEEMIEILEPTQMLKVKADSYHQKYVEIKKRIQELDEKHNERFKKIKTLKQELLQKQEKEKAKRELKLQKELEKRALKKMKSGEKLTWEEFKILAERGIK